MKMMTPVLPNASCAVRASIAVADECDDQAGAGQSCLEKGTDIDAAANIISHEFVE